MVNPNWGLLFANGGNGGFDNALARGMQIGSRIRERREQEAQRNAFAEYAANPTREGAAGLVQYNPQFGMGEIARFDQQAAAAREADVRRGAASGDPAAMAELAGIDLNAWRGLSSDQRQAAASQMEAMGNAAMYVANLPEEQRAAAWDQQVSLLSRQFPELQQYQGQYSPEALASAVNGAGKFMDFWRTQQPDYMVLPENATMVDARNPAAVAQFGGQGGAPQQPQQPQRNSPLFSLGEWNMYQNSVGQGLTALVERERPVIINSQGAQVQTDVLNGQVVYNVNGVWYDNPEGQ